MRVYFVFGYNQSYESEVFHVKSSRLKYYNEILKYIIIFND